MVRRRTRTEMRMEKVGILHDAWFFDIYRIGIGHGIPVWVDWAGLRIMCVLAPYTDDRLLH